MAQLTAPARPAATGQFDGQAGLPAQIALITRRNLTVIFRTPQALLPPLVISLSLIHI